MVLEKTLESPLDSKELKPRFLKETNPNYSLEGLKLKLQYFGHLARRAESLGKTLMLGKIEETIQDLPKSIFHGVKTRTEILKVQ